MTGRRAKRVRRWLVLASAVAGVGLTATLVTHHRQARHEAHLQRLRHDGLAAYQAGDFAVTVAKLDPYLAEHDTDAAALLPFALARAKVETPDGQHLRVAVRSLNQILSLDASQTAARHALLDLLPRTTDTDELERVVEEALAVDAADVAALREKVTVRLRQDRPAEALAAARVYAAAVPSDLDAHVTVLRLMDRQRQPAAELRTYAGSAFAAGDPRRGLLRAVAETAAGDADAALTALQGVTDAAAADAGLARQAVTVFDLLGRFVEARRLLESAVDKTRDADLVRLLAMRLWQAGDCTRLIQSQLPFDADDSLLLGLRAASLYQAGRPADARQLVARIAARRDRAAAAWAIALPARFESDKPINALQKAVAKDADNAVVKAWLAAAYADVNEPVLAIRQWMAAAAIEPAWAVPHAGRAAALLALGCPAEAIAPAQAAYDRTQTTLAVVDLIGVRFAAYEQSADAAAARDLLEAVDRVQAARPMEPRTATWRVVLLSRLGRRAEAAAWLNAVIGDARSSPATRIAMVATAADEGFEMPRTAAQADAPSAAGKAGAAVKDRAARLAAIEHTREVAGDDGRQWRLDKARWLIESSDPADANLAVTLLSDLVREAPRDLTPRLELARALQRGGNPDSAAEHLKLAQTTDPRSAEPLARLVALLRDRGRSNEANELLRRTAATSGLTVRQRLTVAALSLDGGDAETAVSVLDGVADALPPAGRLARAEALARAGRTADAAAAFEALVAGDHAAPAALAAAADFRAAQGDVPAARALLGRLADSPAATLARARFELCYGDAKAAGPLLARAAETGGETARLALIDFKLRTGDVSGALADAVAARTAFPDSRAVADRLLTVRMRSTPQARPDDLRPFIAALTADPERAADARALAEFDALPPDAIDTIALARLRAVALNYPAAFPLQLRLAELALVRGDADEAVAAGRRVASALPDDSAAGWLAVRTLRAAGRWDDVRAAADDWKRRPGVAAVDAASVVADAWLNKRRTDRAADALAGHVARLTADPAAALQASVTLARVRLAQNDSTSAHALLRPIAAGAVGRSALRTLACTDAKTAADGMAWLNEADAVTPADAWPEQAVAAGAWAAIGRRFNDPACLDQALAIANTVLAAKPADTDLRLLQAGLFQQIGRTGAAEAALRVVLETRPDSAAANNDLACLLLDARRGLAEAERRARAAVALSPKSAAFYDTLARVLTATRRPVEARTAFETALRLDPTLQAARDGLADLTTASVAAE